MIQEYLSFISTVLGITFGAIAIFFTWRVYKRENTINNENYIYQKKFDAYERLFSQAVEYLDKAENVLVQLEQLSKSNDDYNNDEYDKAEENFETAEEILELEFQKLVFVLPEGIANILEDLIYKKKSWKAIENAGTWEK